MFSRTTIELSTSIPTPSSKPERLMRFSDVPRKYINTSVITIETGIERPMMSVLLMFFKKMNSTMTAKNAPCTTEEITSLTVLSMMSVLFAVSMISTSSGSSESIFGKAFLTACAAATEFLPLCFCSVNIMHGTPSRYETEVTSFISSLTSAMSRNKIGTFEPSESFLYATTVFSMSESERNAPSALIE